jgi:hypothetical protein
MTEAKPKVVIVGGVVGLGLPIGFHLPAPR